jgi:YD repeat-containing protein
VRGIKLGVVVPYLSGTSITGGTTYTLPQFFISTYDLRTTWFFQKSKEERIYDPADTTKKVITRTNYFYDNPDHIEITREEVSKSTGEHYNVLMRYPKDYNPVYPYNSSPLVEKRVMINNGTTDRLTNAEITTYSSEPGSFPTAYYSLKSTGAVTPSSVALYDGTTIDPAYEKRTDYSFDFYHNMASITKEGLSSTSYLWGYNNQYPIAECKNAPHNDFFYTGFEETEGNTADARTGHSSRTGGYSHSLSFLDNGTYTLSYWQKSGSAWVLQSSNVTVSAGNYTISLGGQVDDVCFYPVNAQMSTLTYDPAVGVTSMTDAKGQTTYYEYDGLQRLMNIKDRYGNIMKHTDYHYQNQ